MIKWHIKKKIVREYYQGLGIDVVAKNFKVSENDVKDCVISFMPRVELRDRVSIPVIFGSRNEPYDDRTEDEMLGL